MRRAFKGLLVNLVVLAGCGELEATDPAAESAADQTATGLSRGGDDDGFNRKRLRCPHDVPAALNPPADATLLTGLAATGVQIYACTEPAAGGAPAWTLKAPHANLVQAQKQEQKLAVIHFGGPSWQALDGSLVTATRAASAPAPDGTSIPWLLLQAATHVGAGVLADVTWIQRLATAGGAAPATGCDADHLGAEVLIPYRADYFFYHPVAEGQRPRQCASQ
jgi:hypothetical protein